MSPFLINCSFLAKDLIILNIFCFVFVVVLERLALNLFIPNYVTSWLKFFSFLVFLVFWFFSFLLIFAGSYLLLRWVSSLSPLKKVK